MSTPTATPFETIMTAHPDCDDCTRAGQSVTDEHGGIGELTTTTTTTDDQGTEQTTDVHHYAAVRAPGVPVLFGRETGCMQCIMTKKKLAPSPVPFVWIPVDTYPAGVDVILALGFQQVPVVHGPTGTWSGYRPGDITALVESWTSADVAA